MNPLEIANLRKVALAHALATSVGGDEPVETALARAEAYFAFLVKGEAAA